MRRNSTPANHYTFPFVLKALADLKLTKEGKSVHVQVIKLGFLNDVYVGNSLLNLYVAGGNMCSCGKVFDEMPLRDVVSWTVMISGFNEAGKYDDSLITFERMRSHGVMPNRVTAVNALAACAGHGALNMGLWIHEYVKSSRWEMDLILGTALIDMYGKCGQIESGLLVFHQMPEKNVCTWNTVIKGLALSKNGKEAIKYFLRMEKEGARPNEVTLIAVLSACVQSGLLHMGQLVFSALSNGKYGFSPNVKHYSCMIDLLVRCGCLDEAVGLIKEMPFEPSVSIWGALLCGCRALGEFDLGEFAALKMVELEPGNFGYYVVLCDFYAENGKWDDVKRVRNRSTFICNTLIRAFSHSTDPQKSPLIYARMRRNSTPANHYTFPFVLKALADLKLTKEGKSVHVQVIKLGFLNDVYVGNSLLNLYVAGGNMCSCGKVFDEMPLRDVVSWTVMISGFNEAGKYDDSLITFERMRSHGVMPNRVTAVNALAACAGHGALNMGLWIHEYVKSSRWEMDLILGTALIDMYGKCGQIESGLLVFHQMPEKNVCTWNTVIKGLALSKNGKEAIKYFLRMEKEGARPNEVTLIAVLSACVQSGLLHMGQLVFSALSNGKYGFSPNVKHYSCMIDLLVRCGCLDEAVGLIKEMPFEPSVSIWGALLCGCRALGEFDLGEFAALKMVELEPGNFGYYVVLCDFYAENGKWDDVKR
ncbi:pentatricopeptide repeat-containing protein, partial [Striga asiatica]